MNNQFAPWLLYMSKYLVFWILSSSFQEFYTIYASWSSSPSLEVLSKYSKVLIALLCSHLNVFPETGPKLFILPWLRKIYSNTSRKEALKRSLFLNFCVFFYYKQWALIHQRYRIFFFKGKVWSLLANSFSGHFVFFPEFREKKYTVFFNFPGKV